MHNGLILSDLHIAIGSRVLVDRLSLTIPPGHVVSVMGPSGSGKSSLIACLCGSIDRAFRVEGSVTLNGRRIDQLPIERRRIGVLFQDDLLFEHMTVGENLAFAIPPGVPRAERRAQVAQALKEAEMPGFESRSPATLSGGQRARASLMRAMLSEPQALLLDEPFSRLDVSLRNRIRDFTFGVIASRNIPALQVTHDQADVTGPVIHLE